jgi:hypothetical protein
MGEVSWSDSTEKGRRFLGRSEIQVGLLWLAQSLVEGNTSALSLLLEAGSVAWAVAVLCVLAGGVGSAGFLLLRIRRVSLRLSDSSVLPVVSDCRSSPLTSNHQVRQCH